MGNKALFDMWIKMRTKFDISSKRQIFLCNIYIPPSDSPRVGNKDVSFPSPGMPKQDHNLTQGHHFPTQNEPNMVSSHRKNVLNKLKSGSGSKLCLGLFLYIANARLRGHSFCSPLGNSTVETTW